MSKTAPDFLKKDNRIDENVMTDLATLIDEYDIAAQIVSKAEAHLKIVKQTFNNLVLEQIPEFLLKHGITKMGLEDGREVKIKEDISPTVTDEFAFREWLKKRSEDDIIKFKYIFAKTEGKKITKLTDFLFEHDFDFEIDESIHAQTKKKYFKELLKGDMTREDLPEWVTIYEIRKAVIK